MSDLNWSDNITQFSRLLAEIRAIGLTDEQYEGLCESMDLVEDDIDELLERAETALQVYKYDGPSRLASTPCDDMNEFHWRGDELGVWILFDEEFKLHISKNVDGLGLDVWDDYESPREEPVWSVWAVLSTSKTVEDEPGGGTSSPA